MNHKKNGSCFVNDFLQGLVNDYVNDVHGLRNENVNDHGLRSSLREIHTNAQGGKF